MTPPGAVSHTAPDRRSLGEGSSACPPARECTAQNILANSLVLHSFSFSPSQVPSLSSRLPCPPQNLHTVNSQTAFLSGGRNETCPPLPRLACPLSSHLRVHTYTHTSPLQPLSSPCQHSSLENSGVFILFCSHIQGIPKAQGHPGAKSPSNPWSDSAAGWSAQGPTIRGVTSLPS